MSFSHDARDLSGEQMSARARRARLFALHRQMAGDDMSCVPQAKPAVAEISPGVAQAMMQAASQSLSPQEKSRRAKIAERLGQSFLPRKPVATTNFSDESDLLAGGLTFATLSKRCFNRA